MNFFERIFAIALEYIQFCIDKILSFFRRVETVEFDNGRKVYIGQKIADGGFSVVYESGEYNTLQGKENKPCFALKRIICGDRDTVEKCQKEASVHRAFNHPNLLPLLALKFDSNGPNNCTVCYMLFPLLKTSLRDEISRRGLLLSNPMPNELHVFKPKDMIEIFCGVVDGASCMYEHGYTHRDIKVENVMLDSMGTPILMDFGSVGPARIVLQSRSDCLKLVDQASENTTMPYRAPELFEGGARYGEDEPDIDGGVDVWSLGCILFALMYGVSPFECEFRGDKVNVVDCSHLRILGNIPTPEPHSNLAKRYDPELMTFVKSMLTQDRTLRPSIEEVLETADEFLRRYGGTRRWRRKPFFMSTGKGDDMA